MRESDVKRDPSVNLAAASRSCRKELVQYAWRSPVGAILALVTFVSLPLLWQRSLWFDEAFSWQLTRFGWSEMFERAARDVHPPLYYILLKSWTALFGDSPPGLRSYSMAWFAVTLGAVYRFLREASDGPECRRVDSGIVGVLIVATSPFLLRYAVEARMYTQLIGLLILSSLFLLRATSDRAGRFWPWFAYTLTGVAAAYTHYIGIFSIAAQGVFVVGLAFARSKGNFISMFRMPLLRFGLLSYAAMTLLYTPWIPSFLAQQSQVAEDYWAPSVEQQSPIRLELWRQLILRCTLHDRAELVPLYPLTESTTYLLGLFLLLVPAILILLLTRLGRPGWLLACVILGPVDLAIINCYRVERNLIEHRYLMCSFVMLLIGVALVIGRINLRPSRWLIAYLVSLNLLCCASNLVHSADVSHRPEFFEIADRISPGDLVISLEPLDYFSLKYHARGRFDVLQLKDDQVINHYNGGPIFSDSDFIHDEQLARKLPGRVWLVGRSASEFPLSVQKLTKTASYELAEAIRWRGRILLTLWERRDPDINRPSFAPTDRN